MKRCSLLIAFMTIVLLSCDPLDIRGRGYINITTQPTGCEVYLDGEKQSDTTNCVIDSVIKGDKIELRIVKGEYLDWTDTVEVSGVDTLKLDLKFTGSLKVTSNPSGASIILDGEATSKTTPHTFDSLLVGSHSLRLEYEGCASVDTTVNVFYEEQTEVSTELSQQFGQIQVNSTPSGAEIWLDGSNTGYTTNHLLGNVGVGSHVLTLMLEGYSDWIDTVVVSEGQTETLDASLDEATGNIQVNSTPTGADIYLDGSNTGKTTNALLEDVTVGSHTVMLVKEGYDDWEQEVMVEDDQTTTINADLGAETGKIQVNSTPTGATIYLDGSNTGKTTDVLLEGIAPGSHTVKLDKEGYIDWDTTLTVEPGQTKTLDITLHQSGTLKWIYFVGVWVYSSPAIDYNGTIYFGSCNKYIYAVTPEGTLKWQYETDGGSGSYLSSSPAIGSDGSVYVGSQVNSNYLYALTSQGNLRWRHEAGQWVHSSPATGSDGTVYVGAADGYLYAINPDGSLKWRYQTGGAVYSSPAVSSDGTVYVGSMYGYYLYAINSNGNLKWRYKTTDGVYSSPAIGSEGTVFVGSLDGYLYAIRPSGDLKWRYQTGGAVESSPAVSSNGTVYVGSQDDYLYAINPDGNLKWRYQTGGNVRSSPAIGSDGTVYVGSSDHYLYAVNTDGSLKWKYQTAGWLNSSPAIGLDGTVYVGSGSGFLYSYSKRIQGTCRLALAEVSP